MNFYKESVLSVEEETKVHRNVKLLTFPTDYQKEYFEHCANASKFVYNWTLDVIEFRSLLEILWNAPDEVLGEELLAIKQAHIRTLPLAKQKEISKRIESGKDAFLGITVLENTNPSFAKYMAVFKQTLLKATEYTDKNGVLNINERKRQKYLFYWSAFNARDDSNLNFVDKITRNSIPSNFSLQAIWTWDKNNAQDASGNSPYAWLDKFAVPRKVITNSIEDAWGAYKAFLKGDRGFPKFKNKASLLSFRLTNGVDNIRLAKPSDTRKMDDGKERAFLTNRIIIPNITNAQKFQTLKMSALPKKYYRPYVQKKGIISHATLKYEGGKWWITLTMNFAVDTLKVPEVRARNRRARGIDLGIGKTNYVTVSPELIIDAGQDNSSPEEFKTKVVKNNGKSHEIFAVDEKGNIQPKRYFEKNRKHLASMQRALAHLRSLRNKNDPASNNEIRLLKKISKLQNKIARQRAAFQDQVASELVKQTEVIAVETLRTKNMSAKSKPKPIVDSDGVITGYAKNNRSSQRGRSRSMADASLGSFVSKIESQAKKRGKEVEKVDAFFPSSKTCNNCGNKKDKLKLSERTYRCEKCGFIEDRDVNASLNIRDKVLGEGIFADKSSN